MSAPSLSKRTRIEYLDAIDVAVWLKLRKKCLDAIDVAGDPPANAAAAGAADAPADAVILSSQASIVMGTSLTTQTAAGLSVTIIDLHQYLGGVLRAIGEMQAETRHVQQLLEKIGDDVENLKCRVTRLEEAVGSSQQASAHPQFGRMTFPRVCSVCLRFHPYNVMGLCHTCGRVACLDNSYCLMHYRGVRTCPFCTPRSPRSACGIDLGVEDHPRGRGTDYRSMLLDVSATQCPRDECFACFGRSIVWLCSWARRQVGWEAQVESERL